MGKRIADDPFVRAQAARIKDVLAGLGVLREAVTAIHDATGYSFSESALSRIQNGLQGATCQEIDVLARVDREERGREWLAWGDEASRKRITPSRGVEPESTLRPSRHAERTGSRRRA